MRTLRFTVPGPPVVGSRPRVVRVPGQKKPRVFMPDRSEAYQKHVAICAWAAARSARWAIPVEGVPIAITVRVYRTVRKGDASNYLKIIEDGINDSKQVWLDDRLVDSISLKVVTSNEQAPRVEVEVTVEGGGEP